MAKTSNNNPPDRFQRSQQQPQQQMPQPPQREPQSRYVFRISWLLVPLCVLGMWYLLSHIHPVLQWDSVMNFLNVHNQERYTRLAILCLVLICIVAAFRILGRKDDQ